MTDPRFGQDREAPTVTTLTDEERDTIRHEAEAAIRDFLDRQPVAYQLQAAQIMASVLVEQAYFEGAREQAYADA